jgi:hypothetical protein
MIVGGVEVSAAIESHREYVMNETLAVRWELPSDPRVYSVEHEEGGLRWTISLSRACDYDKKD